MRFNIFLILIFFINFPTYAWKAEGSCQLLEVYTSEGCSSCPPTDKWISTFKNSNLLWKSVVPLSFHVNYWDYIGWKDKFAKKEYGDRQRKYANLWKSNTVYTPGIVLNGQESNIGSPFEIVKGKLEAEWNGKILTVHGEGVPEKATLHFAWLGLDLVSQVKRGENAGKTLNHDFVVLSKGSLGKFLKGSKIPFSVPLTISETPKALAIWLELDQLPIIAIGNYL